MSSTSLPHRLQKQRVVPWMDNVRAVEASWIAASVPCVALQIDLLDEQHSVPNRRPRYHRDRRWHPASNNRVDPGHSARLLMHDVGQAGARCP